ncbi:MAG: MotA/TolQ/ExbB proton channel family protein [Magnetospirillum sp. WYHS-4]
MSISTIIAIVLSYVLFIGSVLISTSNWKAFIDLPSAVMVVGGTMAGTFMSYEARYVILSLKLIAKVIATPRVGRNVLKAEVGRIIKWAYAVQKNGMPGLEAEAGKAVKGDRFLKFGMEAVLSGYTGQEVRDILTTMIESTYGRNTVPVNILKNMAAAAPAFGMIGTLVGLIIMLDNMGGDPAGLGKGMAVALITTLYGVLLARLVFLPVASKVLQREQIVRFRNYLVMEGLCLLADRKSPRYIQDRMNSFLDPSLHFNIDKMKG